MKPGILPVKRITRGAQLFESYAITKAAIVAEGEEEATPEPVDLTEYTRIKMDVRRTDNPYGDLVYTLDTADADDSIILTSDGTGADEDTTPVLNVINLTHSSLKTILFDADGEYHRDIFFYTGSEGHNLLRGRLLVTYNITEIPAE